MSKRVSTGGLQSSFVEGDDGGVGRIFREGEVGGVLVGVAHVVVVLWLSSGECCRKEDAKSPTKAVNSKMRCLGVLN